MAGPEVHLVQRRHGGGVEAAGLHEPQGTVDLAGDLVVALPLGARADELLGPLVDLRQVGEAALGEGAQQVQRGCRLVVRLDEPLGVRDAGLGGERQVVHDVAAEAGQLDAVDGLGGGGARLGELPGDPAHLHDGDARGVGQDDRHLQDDPQALADGVGGERVEGLSAVAGLEQERLAVGDTGQRTGQSACLTGEDQRGIAGQGVERGVDRVGVGPVGLLDGSARAPARRGPVAGGGVHRGVHGRDPTGGPSPADTAVPAAGPPREGRSGGRDRRAQRWAGATARWRAPARGPCSRRA